MEKNITVKDLVEGFLKQDEKVRHSWISKNVTSEEYVPYLSKCAFAERIINLSSYGYMIDDEGNSVQTSQIRIDSNMRFALYIKIMIDGWTNIKFEDFNSDIDLLLSSGVVDYIVNPEDGVIPGDEVVMFKNILDTTLSDFMTNKYEAHNFAAEMVSLGTSKLVKILNEYLPAFNNISEMLSSMDDKQKKAIGNNIGKIIEKMSK